MTLLDDARRLHDSLDGLYGDLAVNISEDGARWECSMCDATLQEDAGDDDIIEKFVHDPNCPWLLRRAMPKIVAALGAAEALSEFNGKLSFIGGFPGSGELCRLIQALTVALGDEGP